MNDKDKRPLLPHPDRRPSRQQQDAAQPLLPLLRRDSRPVRHSSRTLFQTSPLTDRLSVTHLRRSDLAGWRTRSLFGARELDVTYPTSSLQSFLPVLKLRGLPYFCSKRHVLVWFGDLAAHVVDLFFVAEVEPLNTGFAIVTMDSPQMALQAWRTLHKKPIVGKRFVEVFGLFPPQCPLSRRDSVSGKQGLIPLPPGLEPVNSGDSATSAACPFCGLALGVHSDGGAAALATARMRECIEHGALAGQKPEALMHTAFLSVPALLYQDAGAVSRAELDTFDPDNRWDVDNRRGRGFIEKFAETREVSLAELEEAAGLPLSTNKFVLFFDLTGIQGYDMRALLCEVVGLIYDQPPRSIADIGNELSTRARAYLFLTELKLRNVVESFPEIFLILKPLASQGSYTIALKGDAKVEGVTAIRRMEAFQLTKRRRNRGTEGSGNRQRPDRPDGSARLPRLERNTTQHSDCPGELPALSSLKRSQTAHRRESVMVSRLRPLAMDNRAASYAYTGAPAASSWLHEEDEGSLGAFATSNDYQPEGRNRLQRQDRSYQSLRRMPPAVPEPAAEIGAALTDLIRTLSMEHEDIPSSIGMGGQLRRTGSQERVSASWAQPWADTGFGQNDGELYGSVGGWPQPTLHVREVPPMWAPRTSGVDQSQSEQVLLESLKEKQDEIRALKRALAEHRQKMPAPPYIASGWGVGSNPGVKLDDNSPLGAFADDDAEVIPPEADEQGLLANLAELLQSLSSNDQKATVRIVEEALANE